MSNLDVQKSLASYVTADVTESVADALTKLRNSDSEFIVVTQKLEQKDVPVSVLKEPALMGLASEQNQILDQLLERLPPLLMADENELTDDNLSDVLTILGETKASGLVARFLDNSLGVISKTVVARAVPLDEIVRIGPERSIGGSGSIAVPPRMYICRKCKPNLRRPIRVGNPPNCQVWSHGPMVAE